MRLHTLSVSTSLPCVFLPNDCVDKSSIYTASRADGRAATYLSRVSMRFMRKHMSAKREPAGPPLTGHNRAAMTVPSSISSLRLKYSEMIHAISDNGNPVRPATSHTSLKLMCSYAFCKSCTLPAAQNLLPLQADSARKAVIHAQFAAPLDFPA